MASIRSDISTGRRLYIQAAFGEPVVAALKELGVHWEPSVKCWWISPKKRAEVEAVLVGADQEEDRARDAGEPTPKEDPASIRLVGKARYKGRVYYVRAISSAGDRCRLITLDQSLDFWAPLKGDGDVAAIEKRYEPREERGMYGRGTGRMVHTTLGSIQKFVERQKNPDTRRGECTECGEWGPAGERCQECHEGSHL